MKIKNEKSKNENRIKTLSPSLSLAVFLVGMLSRKNSSQKQEKYRRVPDLFSSRIDTVFVFNTKVLLLLWSRVVSTLFFVTEYRNDYVDTKVPKKECFSTIFQEKVLCHSTIFQQFFLILFGTFVLKIILFSI